MAYPDFDIFILSSLSDSFIFNIFLIKKMATVHTYTFTVFHLPR